MNIPFPELSVVDTELQPRVVRGGLPNLWKRKDSKARVGIGRPLPQPIDASLEGIDAKTLAFVKAEAESSFYLVHLACTFWDDPATPFVSARFQAFLRSRAEHDQPIVWSMFPTEAHDEVTQENSVDIGPSLKVKGFGVSAKASKTTKTTLKLPKIQAFGEQQPDVTWKISRTELTPISGSMRFTVVVRARKGIHFTVRVAADAEIEEQGLLFFTEAKAPADDALTITVP